MCEELEQQYEALRREYQQYIADRLPKEELAERNEVLFSAHEGEARQFRSRRFFVLTKR